MGRPPPQRLGDLLGRHIAQFHRQPQLIEHHQIHVAGQQSLPAEGPHLPHRRQGIGLLGRRGLDISGAIQAQGQGGPEPLQPAAQPQAARQSLGHATLEELAHQHPAAQAGAAKGLAEDRGEAAPVGGGVDLQQALGLGHQPQGWHHPQGFQRGTSGGMGMDEADGHAPLTA